MKTLKPFVWFVILIILVGLACNFGGGGSEPTPEAALPTPPPVLEPSPALPKPAASSAITSLDDLEKAVIYIEAEGSYRDPYEGWQVNAGGSGTGFIIDPSGIAVTNNHVVSGASNLKVWLAGESSPRNARVLGVAECSDLAVLDIDGDSYPYLDWFDGTIKAGIDVYTAGFPISGAGMGYSLTKGIVSKPKASVDWDVASVDSVIEHTARVNPGNSGGPLVNEQAQVVGVNFGFNSTLDQNYAVARDQARNVIDTLRTGQDVDTLGINGVAVSGDLDGNPVTGVWVRSVKSGSPADQARIQPGDIITIVENQVLDDGTLGGYCDIVRSHRPGDVLSVTVIRADTLEVMEGQFSGRALEVTSTLGSSSSGGQGNPNANNPGEIYLSTEFDDSEGWYLISVPKVNENTYRTYTDNSELYMEISPDDTTLYAFHDLVIENPDVRVETYAQKVSGPNTNNISVTCRASDQGWYEFSITSGGYWYIWLYSNGRYKQLATGATTAINLKDRPNLIAATCIDKELTLYVNDQAVGSVSDRTFTDGGQVGVSIYSEYPDLGVVFDWFIASVP